MLIFSFSAKLLQTGSHLASILVCLQTFMVPSVNATSSTPFALVQPHHTSTTVLHCQEDAFAVVILVRLLPHPSHTNFICLDLIWLKHAPDVRLTSFCVLCQSFILLQIFFLLVLHTVWAATKNSDFRLPWSQIWCSRSCKLSLHSVKISPVSSLYDELH